MCFSDLRKCLADYGIIASEPQLRWAIKKGRVPKPHLDGSLRYVFDVDHVEAFIKYFTDQDEQKRQKQAERTSLKKTERQNETSRAAAE